MKGSEGTLPPCCRPCQRELLSFALDSRGNLHRFHRATPYPARARAEITPAMTNERRRRLQRWWHGMGRQDRGTTGPRAPTAVPTCRAPRPCRRHAIISCRRCMRGEKQANATRSAPRLQATREASQPPVRARIRIIVPPVARCKPVAYEW
jgi:hypothetical protein